MPVIHTWEIPQGYQTLTSLALTNKDSLWIANSSDTLLHLSPEMKTGTPVKVMTQEGSTQVAYVTPGQGDEVWVIIDQDASNAGTWNPQQHSQVKLVSLAKEPRQLAWIDSLSTLWYIATDLSLNVHVNGQDKSLDEGKYNALVVSQDGNLAAVRQSGTDDVLITSTQEINWKKVRSNFGGELLGIAPDNSLVLLEVGVAKKGGQSSDSRLLFIQEDGTQKSKSVEAVIAGKVQGNKLVMVRRNTNGKLVIELTTLD
jgi:hypothetical protein